VAGVMPAAAQDTKPTPRPAPLKVETRQELNRREALKLYTFALICEKEDRLLEAVRNLEKAARLDPESAAIPKALIPLYRVLERPADALAACRQAVRLDPGDYETWLVYARQLKAQGRLKQAQAALARGVRCEGLKGHPDARYQMYFDLGVVAEKARDFTQAAKAFTEAVQVLEKPEELLAAGPFDRDDIKARAAELWERLGRVCVQAKLYDQAVRAFTSAQAKGGDNAGRLNYHLAEVYRAQGKYAKALTALDAYLKLQPQGLEPYELKIALLKKLNRQKEIVPAIEAYVANDRFNTGLKLLLARQYEAFGSFQKAEDIFLDLQRGTPNADLYRGLFRLYKNAGRMGQVLKLLDRDLREATGKDNPAGKSAASARARYMLLVLRDEPALVGPLLEAAQKAARGGGKLAYETRYYLAVLAARARKLDVAEKYYRECLPEVTRENEMVVYDGLLKVLWQARNYGAVIKLCQEGLKATRINPVVFHFDLARALPLVGKTDEALVHANKAVELSLDENRLMLRLQRAQVNSLAGRHAKAVAECEELLKSYKEPRDVHDIRYTLSGIYSAARNYPKAEEELKRILKAHPDDATAYNDLGYLWADQNKNLKQAEEYIRKAITLDRRQKEENKVVGADSDQDNAAYVDSLGWVLFRRGQVEAARRELEKASGLPNGDDDPVVWDHLADVYFRLGQAARARAAWKKAISLFEVEKRRKIDQRYKDIKDKLKLLERETQP
jgi:tetratricopeptide (TPR) repeat protein